MIAEREIEEAIKARLADALAGMNVRTIGSWDVAAAGDVKGDGDASSSVVAVAVGLRTYEGFISPIADVPCSVSLSVRRDACPTGAELATAIEPLMAVIHAWNADLDAVEADFSTTSFAPAGFRLSGSSGPEYDASTAAWTVALDFVLRGVINTNEEN